MSNCKNMPSYKTGLIFLFLKFTSAGSVGTLIHYLSMGLLIELYSCSAVMAATVGAILGALANFLLSYKFVFESSQNIYISLVKFFIVASIGIALNAVIVYVLCSQVKIHYGFAQIVATTLVLLWTFLANTLWSFRADKSVIRLINK